VRLRHEDGYVLAYGFFMGIAEYLFGCGVKPQDRTGFVNGYYAVYNVIEDGAVFFLALPESLDICAGKQ
jgi:hypothetical protein